MEPLSFPTPKTMQTTTKVKLVAFIFLILGPIFAVIANKENQRMTVIQKDGVTVDGTITGGSKQRKKRSTSYTLNVQFGGSGIGIVRKAFDVTSEFYDSHVSGSAISNPEVKVRYLAANPQESLLVGGSPDNSVVFWISAGAGVAGLITLIVMFTRKSAPAVA